MIRIAPSLACATALLLLAGCQNVPKYKKSSGKFNEWASYEHRKYTPADGIVTAVDTAARSITITQGGKSSVFAVTAATRIMHEGTDIPLGQLPLNQAVKFTLADDRAQLLTVWYGAHSFAVSSPGVKAPSKAKTSAF